MDTSPDNPRRPPRRVDHPQLTLRDLLAAVAGTRQTRVELLSAKLEIDEARVRPAWDLALRTELLEPVSIEPGTGETMYRLSPRGRRALRVLSLGRRSPHRDE